MDLNNLTIEQLTICILNLENIYGEGIYYYTKKQIFKLIKTDKYYMQNNNLVSFNNKKIEKLILKINL